MSDQVDTGALGYALATRGIPSDITEDLAGDYPTDPWRPAPNVEVVTIIIPADATSDLTALVRLR